MSELLDPAAVAERFGWQRSTVHRELWQSRRKVADGLPLGPADLPLPWRQAGRTPLWREADINAAVAARARVPRSRPGRPVTSAQRPRPASEAQLGDVVIVGPYRRRVVAVAWPPGGDVALLLTLRRRDPGKWERYAPDTELMIYRPPLGTGGPIA